MGKNDVERARAIPEQLSAILEKTRPRNNRGTVPKLWLAVTVALLAVGLWAVLQSTSVDNGLSDIRTYTAEEGPLWITVVETGRIRARDPIVLRSEVAWSTGPPQILWLIPEGQDVKKGDLLVRIDASLWENQLLERELWRRQTEAGLISGREGVKVTKSRTESEITSAELAVRFAKEDLKKYIEGDFPNQKQEARKQVILAESAFATAADDVDSEEQLFAQEFSSRNELDIAKRRLQRASLQVELAKGRDQLLRNFSYKRTVAQLESDVEETKRELERTKRKAKADLVKAEAGLSKSEQWSRYGTRHHNRILKQIENCEIHAPADGTVLYAPRHEPLQEGQTIHERQELIHLLTNSAVMADIGVRESDLGNVKIGQRVRLTVDAFPGEEFTGQISSIAIMPDAEKSWMSPGPKVYATELFIDGDGSALRNGMSCRVEIIVEHYEKAVSVPVEAVLSINGQHTVYVYEGGEIVERSVDVGMANESMIRISAHLAAGERVLLSPPLEQAAVDHDLSFSTIAVDGVETTN